MHPDVAADLIVALMVVVVDFLIVVGALMRSSSDQAFPKVLWPCGLEAEKPAQLAFKLMTNNNINHFFVGSLAKTQ